MRKKKVDQYCASSIMRGCRKDALHAKGSNILYETWLFSEKGSYYIEGQVSR